MGALDSRRSSRRVPPVGSSSFLGSFEEGSSVCFSKFGTRLMAGEKADAASKY